MTTLETHMIFVLKELVPIQEKVFWCEFEEVSKSARLNKEVLADKDEVDKEKVDKNKV